MTEMMNDIYPIVHNKQFSNAVGKFKIICIYCRSHPNFISFYYIHFIYCRKHDKDDERHLSHI